MKNPSETQAVTAAPKPNKGLTMLDKVVMLQIETKRLGGHRKVSSEYIEADTDKSLCSVSKKLFDSDEFKAIESHDAQVREYVLKRCSPSVIKRGVFLLPLANVEKVSAALAEFKVRREQLVEAFVQIYPVLVQQMQMRQGELFDVTNYPGVTNDPTGEIDDQGNVERELKFADNYGDMLRANFSVTWNYTTFGVPDVLKQIDQKLFDEEKQKQAEMWSEAGEVIQQLKRAQMLKLVQNLNDRLTPGDDGKLKQIKTKKDGTTPVVDNIKEFLDEFAIQDITNDTDLAQMVEKAKLLIDGVDPELLKKGADVRAALAEGFTALESELATMVTDAPKRGISFDEV